MPVESSPSLDDLLRVLNSATDRDRIQWGTTAEEDTFRTDLGNALVRVSKTTDGRRYSLSLIDLNGALLDEFHTGGEDDIPSIEPLYKKARNKALNIEWKLKGLYDRLKTLAGEA